MKHVVAARHRLRPTRIRFEIRREETQLIACVHATLLQQGAHIRFARKIAHCRAHAISGAEQLQNAVTGNKAGTASHEHGAVGWGHPGASFERRQRSVSGVPQADRHTRDR